MRNDWRNAVTKVKAKTTKKTARTGAKKTATRTAGKTARAKAFKVPRTAKQLAEGITARLKRSPDYWNDVKMAMATWENPRAAQVMPRTNAPETHATH